jgi:hypothetical protein
LKDQTYFTEHVARAEFVDKAFFFGVIADENFSGTLGEEENMSGFLTLLNDVFFRHILNSLKVLDNKIDYLRVVLENRYLTQ